MVRCIIVFSSRAVKTSDFVLISILFFTQASLRRVFFLASYEHALNALQKSPERLCKVKQLLSLAFVFSRRSNVKSFRRFSMSKNSELRACLHGRRVPRLTGLP